MGYRITVCSATGEKFRITGYRTSNPHVWVTKWKGYNRPFALTHRPSGLAIIKDLPTLQLADFAWSLIKVFPIDWSEDKPSGGKYKPVLKAINESFKEVA